MNGIAEHSMHIAVYIDIGTAQYLIHLHRRCIAAHMIISCAALPIHPDVSGSAFLYCIALLIQYLL